MRRHCLVCKLSRTPLEAKLFCEVIEKQKLQRILKDIMTLEAERKQEAPECDMLIVIF